MSQNIQTAPIQLNEKTIRMIDGLYCLNDLHKASGGDRKFQPANFMRLESTQNLINEITSSSDVRIKPFNKIQGRGKDQGTYVCRELVYAYAMWISPAFHLSVIRFFDAGQKPQAVAVVKEVYLPNNIGRFLITNTGNGVSTIRDASNYHIVSIQRMNQILNHIQHLSQQLAVQSQQLQNLAAAITSGDEIPPMVSDLSQQRGW